jgi:hypothetical protein
VQAPAPVHTKGHGVPALLQLPTALQTCGCRPRHCLEVGEQSTHAPDRQTAEHVVVSCQLPVASQVCRPFPVNEQRVVPGRQTPVHCPAPVQTLVQGEALCQLPVASHVCGVVPLHCIDPGVHTPTQRGTAIEQTNPQAGPSLTLVPVESQRSGCRPWHLRLPGLQSVHTPSFKQTVQACASRHVPVASQVWDMLRLHRLDPGTQVPAHAPPEQRNGHTTPVLAQ